jgi:hypothetical protein
LAEFDGVELAIAGVTVGVVLLVPRGEGDAEELSVDTGTTETPVFEVVEPTGDEVAEVGPLLGLESEVGLGVPDGTTVELTLGAEEGTKDETLEPMVETVVGALGVVDGVKDATVSGVEVP